MGPHHAILPALAHVFYSMWSTNVVYAVLGFSAAALIQAELRDRDCQLCSEETRRFRIVGCLSRGRPPDKKDVWTVAKEKERDADAGEEEQAVEPEVHNLARAIERLRFKIDALTLRRQAAALCLTPAPPNSLMALPPPPPPRIPSPPQSQIALSRPASPALSDKRTASP
ncbi:hypothetical protein AURDEDRAFT_147377 [Auricularia subglabra TFB-10046 SS5]|nr:hypothetical protein AURDEDRAFT_147377 [Auricularia subglabra TFB-10046 SS5]